MWIKFHRQRASSFKHEIKCNLFLKRKFKVHFNLLNLQPSKSRIQKNAKARPCACCCLGKEMRNCWWLRWSNHTRNPSPLRFLVVHWCGNDCDLGIVASTFVLKLAWHQDHMQPGGARKCGPKVSLHYALRPLMPAMVLYVCVCARVCAVPHCQAENHLRHTLLCFSLPPLCLLYFTRTFLVFLKHPLYVSVLGGKCISLWPPSCFYPSSPVTILNAAVYITAELCKVFINVIC